MYILCLSLSHYRLASYFCLTISMFGEIALGPNLDLSSTNSWETRETPLRKLYQRVGTLSHTHPRVMPPKPVRSYYNSFQKLCRKNPCILLHSSSRAMSAKPIRFHLNPFQELCRQSLYALA